jgi:hypothetical protein
MQVAFIGVLQTHPSEREEIKIGLLQFELQIHWRATRKCCVLFALNIHLMEMKFKTEAGDCDMP